MAESNSAFNPNSQSQTTPFGAGASGAAAATGQFASAATDAQSTPSQMGATPGAPPMNAKVKDFVPSMSAASSVFVPGGRPAPAMPMSNMGMGGGSFQPPQQMPPPMNQGPPAWQGGNQGGFQNQMRHNYNNNMGGGMGGGHFQQQQQQQQQRSNAQYVVKGSQPQPQVNPYFARPNPSMMMPMPGAQAQMQQMPSNMPLPGGQNRPPNQQQVSSMNATSAPAFKPSGANMQVPPQGAGSLPPSNPFSLNRPQANPPKRDYGQATNPVIGETPMSVQVREFKPSGAMNVNVGGFVPSSRPFVPQNTGMSTGATVFQPVAQQQQVPQQPPKPVEPPKEKYVLMIERIVKGSDTDVKSDQLTSEDKQKVTGIKETIDKVKTEKKLSVELLKTFITQMSEVTKKPENLVKMSVHGRIIARGDDGEEKPLIDKKEGGRLNRPSGEYQGGYNDRRGGRGRNRGGFETGTAHPHPGRGRGGDHHRGDDRGGFDKRPADEQTLKFQSQLSQNAQQMMAQAKASKNEIQRVRLILNQITQDNVDRKIAELRNMLIGDRKLLSEEGFDPEAAKDFQINDEILGIVVQTIFRKAQVEHKYSQFYSQKICATIVKIDLESQGKKSNPNNLKFCQFRKKLLDYCRSCFEEIFQVDDFETLKTKAEEAGKKYTQDDHKEMMLKRQHKLFGNIEFIGELFTCHLLRGDTAKSIFEHLLHEQCFVDDTVEAAIKFIEKIGPSIEEKLKQQTDGKQGGARKFSQEEYDAILAKFDSIWRTSEQPSDPSRRVVSKRIQKLIQNMIENQELGWTKLKQNDTSIKSKDQIVREMQEKAQKAAAEQPQQRGRDDGAGRGRGGRERGGGDNRRNDRRDNEHVYMQKQSSTMSSASDASRGGKGGGRGNRRGAADSNSYQAKPAQKEQVRAAPVKVTEDQLMTKIQVVFKKFVMGGAQGEEEEKAEDSPFQVVKDLLANGQIETEDKKDKKVFIEDITSALLQKFVDMDPKEVSTNFESFMRAWLDANTVPADKWKFAVKRAIIDLENQISELPSLPKLLTKGLILPLLSQGSITIADLAWYKEEEKDELFDLRGQFQVGAVVLDGLVNEGKQTKEQIASAFTSAHSAAFAHMKQVSEDNSAEELTEIKETWLEENVSEANREFIISTLGLE